MLTVHQSAMPVQITGPASAIDEVLETYEIYGAKRLEWHAKVWIEAPAIPPDLEVKIRGFGCKVHDRSASAAR